MKLATLALLVLLLTNMFVATEPSQQPTKVSELKKIESRIKELNHQPDNVEVDASGDNDSPRITIEVKKVEVISTVSAEAGGRPTTLTTKETLNINLSESDIPDEYINRTIKAAFLQPKRFETCPPVVVSQIGNTPNYLVERDYTYNAGQYKITAWKGVKYDRASIPRIFWVIIDKDTLSNVAPLFHDLLYGHGGKLPPDKVVPYRKFSREEADDLFKELMGKCGVGPVTREIAYQAVRKFSRPFWND